jgi:uncharacterized membrane protein YfcA
LLLDAPALAVVAALGMIAAVVGGIGGFGTGIILTAALAPLIGVKAVIPVLAVAGAIINAGRFWFYRRNVERRTLVLVLASALTSGVGVILISLLLGAGMSGPAVLATDALVSIALDVCKAALFQRLALLDEETFVTGVVIGVATIPGSAIAAWLVHRMHAHLHVVFMEGLILVGGASLLWNSWR